MFQRALFLLPILAAAAAAQAVPTLDAGYREMYNLEFAQAHQTFHEYQLLHPADPLAPASDAAAYLFSEFDRLHILQSEFFTHDQHFMTDHKLTPDPVVKQKFEAALQASRNLVARAPADKNSQFSAILCNGLESDYAALIDKHYGVSFQKMKASRQMAERLLAQDPTYYDAWLAVGVENYMLSIKPAPVRWLMRLAGAETDRTVGIEKLKLTAEKGHYLAPFAKLLLAVAALRDHNTARARDLLAWLERHYPRNPLYPQELARIDRVGARGASQ